jgi:hypothetical protein
VRELKEEEWKSRLEEIASAKEVNEKVLGSLMDDILRAIVEESGKNGG